MVMANSVNKLTAEAYNKALDQYGEKESENNGTENYTVPYRYVRRVDQKRRRTERAGTALQLLPRTFLVSFISEYDAFLGKMISQLFLIHPEKINESDRSMTYKELMGYDSMESVRACIIENEVGSVLRKSHAEQFDWMERKFDIKLRNGLERWPTFIELTERRNLFVHCDGKISTQYLKVCDKHGVDIVDLVCGEELVVSRDYLVNSYKCLYEFGVKLIQVMWRKHQPEDLRNAEKSLMRVTFDLLVEEQDDLAVRLLKFSLAPCMKYSQEKIRRMLVMNLAQAYKFSKNENECRNLLENDDWSACGDDFLVCHAVLRDEFDNAVQIMKRIGANGILKDDEYLEWPIFRKFRESEEFKKCFEEIFEREPVASEERKKDQP